MNKHLLLGTDTYHLLLIILHVTWVSGSDLKSLVQNGRKYIPFQYLLIKIVDLRFDNHGVLLNFKLNHIDFHFASVNMKFTDQ